MHWYLRVAGAFELVILCLVQKQAPQRFQWQDNEQNSAKSELIYQKNDRKSFRLSMYKIITQLLAQGKSEEVIKNQRIQYQITPIERDSNWQEFKRFYTPIVSIHRLIFPLIP
ncbi:hypothetical protein [Dactylococcopsis salina]|uniref:Uncharacterized protein n=1 Tax=Dactylococcopsis salina (strain PCC 8305) TaxID=13035 RepID=K9YTS7_DACS8|nr:hypothetical protein [Dactylococcopsis salina]AFZ49740.1 hypothetical protein Dacsa_1025 [Dactylococcopsis salina PCC 8305]